MTLKNGGYMKFISGSLVVFLLMFYMIFFIRISPGEVGVVVNLFGSTKGVEEEEKGIGIHFVPPWKSVYRFPVFEQNYQWTGEDAFVFQTSEGLSVKSEIGITFNLMQDKVHELFCKYRRGMEEITHLFIRNNVRDAVNRFAAKLKIEDLYGPKKEEFFYSIKEELNRELYDLGFNISHIYIIGQFEVPETVKMALNKKIEAIQRAQQRENELREAEAEARKEIAIMDGVAKSKVLKAQADAKANALVSQSLTKELLEWEAIKKWDGKLPNAVGGSNMPFLMNLKDKQ
jgi:regulator of protease activity HflC (stomatin/prohibitin superfamily)